MTDSMTDNDRAPSDKIKAFLAEYRDLVHRHGLGLSLNEVTAVSDPDAHVSEITTWRAERVSKAAKEPQAP